MIELLTQILRFAAESPQNALVVIGFFGAFGMFAPKQSAPVERRETPRKKAQKRKRVVKKNLTPQKPKKQKKAKADKWFEAPPLSPWQDEIFTRYRVGRDFTFQS